MKLGISRDTEGKVLEYEIWVGGEDSNIQRMICPVGSGDTRLLGRGAKKLGTIKAASLKEAYEEADRLERRYRDEKGEGA